MLPSVDVQCPYCGEWITVVVDDSAGQQDYIRGLPGVLPADPDRRGREAMTAKWTSPRAFRRTTSWHGAL